MQSSSNFYEALGVPQNASIDEIKKAYRKLSFIHHPDKNNSPESTQMFQKLAEAYSVLSDPGKRQQYDMELKFGGRGSGGGGGHRVFTADINPHDIFNMLFGRNAGVNPHGSGNDGGIPLGGLFHGLNAFAMNGGMGGFGGEIHIIHQGDPAVDFMGMGGIGGMGGFNPFLMHLQQHQQRQQQQQQQQQQQEPSNSKKRENDEDAPKSQSQSQSQSKRAKHTSNVVKPDPIEKTITISFEQAYTGVDVNLEYEKVIYENDVFGNVTQQTLRLTVPKGVRNLESVTIPNAGNVSADGVCGDLIITVVLQPHAVFSTVTLPVPAGSGIPATASPLDIILHKSISLKDSLCGFQFDFTHLNGKSYQILNRNVGSVIQPESVKTIKGLGFERAIDSDSNGGVECGSLHIFFHVVYPESISEDLQTALSNLLP